jgi:hypothetical protein
MYLLTLLSIAWPDLGKASQASCIPPFPCRGPLSPFPRSFRIPVFCLLDLSTRHPCRIACSRFPLPSGPPPALVLVQLAAMPWSGWSTGRTGSNKSLCGDENQDAIHIQVTCNPLSILQLGKRRRSVSASFSRGHNVLFMFISVHSWILVGSWCWRWTEAARKTRSSRGVS